MDSYNDSTISDFVSYNRRILVGTCLGSVFYGGLDYYSWSERSLGFRNSRASILPMCKDTRPGTQEDKTNLDLIGLLDFNIHCRHRWHWIIYSKPQHHLDRSQRIIPKDRGIFISTSI